LTFAALALDPHQDAVSERDRESDQRLRIEGHSGETAGSHSTNDRGVSSCTASVQLFQTCFNRPITRERMFWTGLRSQVKQGGSRLSMGQRPVRSISLK